MEEDAKNFIFNKHVGLGQSHMKWNICCYVRAHLQVGIATTTFCGNVLSCLIPLCFHFSFNPGRLGEGILITLVNAYDIF